MSGVSPEVAYELLAGSFEQGQALVERAGFVGDVRDYESWKAARNEWIARTVDSLAQIYPRSDEGERFRSAASAAGGGRWQMDYSRDLECTRAALDIVASLRDGVDPGGEPAGDAGSADEQPPQAEGASEQSAPSPAEREQAQHERAQHVESRTADEERDHPELGPEPAGRPDLAPALPARSGPALAPASEEVDARGTVGGNELVGPSANGSASPAPTTTSTGRKLDGSRQVFLVHGRNESVRQAVDHLLGRAGEHEVTTLNQRPNDRKMLVEQFEREPAGTRYAIVLLTADDVGAPRLDSEQEPYFSPRARQGVVFEMGFLVAALSPRCVCVLYEDGVEMPCDLDGIAYIRLDLAGNWRSKLLLQLRSAGFDYDLNSLAPA